MKSKPRFTPDPEVQKYKAGDKIYFKKLVSNRAQSKRIIRYEGTVRRVHIRRLLIEYVDQLGVLHIENKKADKIEKRNE